MAAETKKPPVESPFLRLNEEAVQHLDDIGKEIDAAEAIMDDLEELGIDQSRLRSTVKWAKGVREVVMKHSNYQGKK